MKKITINNQEFEEINASIPLTEWVWYQNKWYKPVEQFKVGDWVIFQISLKQIVRRIISDEEYNSAKNSQILYDKYKEWMTEGAAIELKNQIIKKATSQEILEHLRALAKEKGLVKGAKVKGIQSNSELLLHTIVQDDDDYYLETDEYAKSGIILYSNGKWAEKVEEVEDYQILSLTPNNKSLSFLPCLNDKVSFYNNTTGYTTYTIKEALSKGFKIHSLKDLKTGNVYTVGDKVSCNNDIKFIAEVETFNLSAKNEILAWVYCSKPEFMVGLTLNKIEPYTPKFTFGGYEVSFKVIPNSRERPLKFVEVTCKGETGANYEIFNILENPLKRLPFGKVFTRGFTLKEELDAQKHIPTIEKGTESSYINEIQIGCLVDKYENLVKIYEHCLTLLKWD